MPLPDDVDSLIASFNPTSRWSPQERQKAFDDLSAHCGGFGAAVKHYRKCKAAFDASDVLGLGAPPANAVVKEANVGRLNHRDMGASFLWSVREKKTIIPTKTGKRKAFMWRSCSMRIGRSARFSFLLILENPSLLSTCNIKRCKPSFHRDGLLVASSDFIFNLNSRLLLSRSILCHTPSLSHKAVAQIRAAYLTSCPAIPDEVDEYIASQQPIEWTAQQRREAFDTIAGGFGGFSL
ncbi:hypothetical protein C8R47DRAFT_801699 [Mycena vitilis]|nr:hypothetical protein C8R47DRAFT_801699 [Mycena vitilis]